MQYISKTVTHAFTLKSDGITNALLMDIEITVVGNPSQSVTTKAIWDTGATNTVITKEVVAKLGLVATGFTEVNTASETNRRTNTYLVDIKLKADLTVSAVQVTEGVILSEKGIDCLLGMDIISLGDFSITNFEGKTWLSFRIPSQHKVDFVEKVNNEMAVINRHFALKKSFNNPCVCGSGKKFKNCHGKNLEEV